jgi:hypothetical protein
MTVDEPGTPARGPVLNLCMTVTRLCLLRQICAPICTLLLAALTGYAVGAQAQPDFQIVWVAVGEAATADKKGVVRAGRQLFDVSDLAALSLDNVRVIQVEALPVVTELRVGEAWCLTQLQMKALGANSDEVPSAPLSITVRQDHREHIGLTRTRKNICLKPTQAGEYPLRLTSLLPAPDGSTRGAQIFLRVDARDAQAIDH